MSSNKTKKQANKTNKKAKKKTTLAAGGNGKTRRA